MNISDKSLSKCMWAFVSACLLASLIGIGRAADDKGYPAYKGPVAPFLQVISTNSVCVLPDRSRMNAPAFAIGTTYAQGTVVESRGLWYMTVNGGMSGTNFPHHSSGEVSDGTNTWRCIPSGPRKGWAIYNGSTNTVMLGYGYRPTATTGVALLSGGTWYEDTEGKHSAVFAICAQTNGLLTGVEL